MSELTSIDKMKLEKILGMSGGYVLGFSNKTFHEFVLLNTNKDIYDDIYSQMGESKANRLRVFWKDESNYVVSKLLYALLEYWKAMKLINEEDIEVKENLLFEECIKIADSLKQGNINENIEIIMKNDFDDMNFLLLAKAIKDSIEKNEPELALDRLHTYTVKYIRIICERHGIEIGRDRPLHSCFGEYIKFLKNNHLLESKMTETILKYAISILDAFNDVRNNRSLAHDNVILNYEESMLIFKSITIIIEFISSIESKNATNQEPKGLYEEIFEMLN